MLITLGTSCSNSIDIEQPDYERKVVVDGWIESDDFAHVFLTYSSPFLTEYDSTSIRQSFLNNAKVTILASNGESEVLTLFRKSEFFPPFVYKTTRIKGAVGLSYTLTIEIFDKKIESTTFIPNLPQVKSISMLATSDTTAILNTLISDPIYERNYYYFQILTKNYSTQFHQAYNPLTTDRGFNGSDKLLTINRSTQPDPLQILKNDTVRLLPRFEFSIKDTVLVKISCLDSISFNVLQALHVDELSNGNPFAMVDKKTSTNIQGGIGRWTGFATYKAMVYYNKK